MEKIIENVVVEGSGKAQLARNCYNKALEIYLEVFRWYYFPFMDDIDEKYVMEAGGSFRFGEYVFTMDDIRYAVDECVGWDVICGWFEYCGRVSENLPSFVLPTLEGYVRGSGIVSEESLCRIEDLRRELDEEIERVRGEIG